MGAEAAIPFFCEDSTIPGGGDPDEPTPVVIDSSCDEPVYVSICDDPTPLVDAECSLACNEDTDLFDLVCVTFTDGVPGDPVITPTGIPCDDNPPDIEAKRVCVGGFVHLIVCAYDEEGAETVLTDTNTEEPCGIEPTFSQVRECRDGFINIVTTQIDPDGTCTEIKAVVTEEICGPVPVIDPEFTLVCNSDTDLYDLYEIIYTDGVAGDPTITPTDLPCEPALDVEQVRVCDSTTNTIHVITTAFDEEGNEVAVLADTDTGEICSPPLATELVCMLQPVPPFTINNGVTSDCDINSGDFTAGDPWTFTWSPTASIDGGSFCYPGATENADGSFTIEGVLAGPDDALYVVWPVAGVSDTNGVAVLPGHFVLDGVCYPLDAELCSGGNNEITITGHMSPIEVGKQFGLGTPATFFDCVTGSPVDATGWLPCSSGEGANTAGEASGSDCETCGGSAPETDPQPVQEPVCVQFTKEGFEFSGAYSSAPDDANDVVGVRFCTEDDNGEVEYELSTPADGITWSDLASGQLAAQIEAQFPWVQNVQMVPAGPENTWDVTFEGCFPDGIFGVMVKTSGGDWNNAGNRPAEVTVQQTGILCTDKISGETILVSQGEVVEEYDFIDCEPEPEPPCPDPECVKWQSVFVLWDNTGTRFDEATEWVVDLTDGTTESFMSGPHAGWSEQVTDIAAQADALLNGTYDPRCTFGCGGLLPPPSDVTPPPGIFARYINGVHCPTDTRIPIKVTAVRESGKEVVVPFFVQTGPEYRGWTCPSCCPGEKPALLDEDFNPVEEADLPVCTFNCAETIPEAPLAECQFEILSGNWCDEVLSGDPDVDNEIVQSEIIVEVSTCGADQVVGYFTVVDDGLEPYEPVGTVVDCETGAEPVIPTPPCPEGLVPEQVCVPGDYKFLLDNSLWGDGIPLPGNHLQNGKDYVIALFDANGIELSRTGPLSDPYYNGLIKNPWDGCSITSVCANHTSPKGCNAGLVARYEAFIADIPQAGYDAPTFPGDIQNNVTNPDQSELWASGWGVACAGCSEPPAYAEIVDSSDPAWIGARKNVNVWQVADQILFRSVDPCGGIYWQDCEGNPVEAPAGACCAKPCAPDSEPNPLDEVIGDSCCDGDSEGGTGEEGCAVEELTQNEHSGFSVFGQDGAPAVKFAPFSTELTAAINAAIEGDCIFMLKHGDGATFIGDGNTSPAGDTGGVMSPGLETATTCDGTELQTVPGDQGTPSTVTLVTYCGKADEGEAGDKRQVVFTEDKCANDTLADIHEAIVCTKTECADPCANGSTYINGRPPAANAWSWGPYSGENLNEFEAALTAAGYTVTSFGEKHQICPPFGAFGENPDALVDNGIEPYAAVVEPNINPDYVATPLCADRTVGCNDDRRDALLETLVDALTCEHSCAESTIGQRVLSQGRNFTLGGVTGETWDEFVEALNNTGTTVELGTIYNDQGQEITDVLSLTICAGVTPGDTLAWDTFLPGAIDLTYESALRPCCTICEQNAADAAEDGTDCVVTTEVVAGELDADGCITLPAGARYTIFFDRAGMTLDGAPIPCGVVLNVPDCCGCVTDTEHKVCVPPASEGEPAPAAPTVIKEVKTAIVKGTVKELQIKQAVKAVRTVTLVKGER